VGLGGGKGKGGAGGGCARPVLARPGHPPYFALPRHLAARSLLAVQRPTGATFDL